MAAKGKKHWWDPYETSQKREFFYRPHHNTEVSLPATSISFRDSYSPSGPVASTAYNEEFCWKPVSKPECIHTGSASAERRNNPHPSQGFLTWRLPKGGLPSSADNRLPEPDASSEQELWRALTGQYCSTYRSDFLGIPQGSDHSTKEGQLAPLHSRRHAPHLAHTETRDDYRQPKRQYELQQGNQSRYGCNTSHGAPCRGIVPTVVPRQVCNQDHAELTTYDAFFGNKASIVSSTLKSLPLQELRQLCKILPEKDTEVVKSLLRKETRQKHVEEVLNPPAVRLPTPVPQWTSDWPGPQ